MISNKRAKESFTLVEILVSAVLIGLSLLAFAGIFLGGSYFLKQAENKSRAMSLASLQMERLLAKSYSPLTVGDENHPAYSGNNDKFKWEVQVQEKGEGGDPDNPNYPICDPSNFSQSQKCIPYKQITVAASYPENTIRGNEEYKQVKLVNIKPYPYIHLGRKNITSGGEAPYNSYAALGNLELEFSYPIDKDIIVIYNIALDIQVATGIQTRDTIYTVCFLDGEPQPIETRTPIITQPLISNAIEIDSVEKRSPNNKHKLEIKWYKDTSSGVISLKKAELIAVAFEAK